MAADAALNFDPVQAQSDLYLNKRQANPQSPPQAGGQFNVGGIGIDATDVADVASAQTNEERREIVKEKAREKAKDYAIDQLQQSLTSQASQGAQGIQASAPVSGAANVGVTSGAGAAGAAGSGAAAAGATSAGAAGAAGASVAGAGAAAGAGATAAGAASAAGLAAGGGAAAAGVAAAPATGGLSLALVAAAAAQQNKGDGNKGGLAGGLGGLVGAGGVLSALGGTALDQKFQNLISPSPATTPPNKAPESSQSFMDQFNPKERRGAEQAFKAKQNRERIHALNKNRTPIPADLFEKFQEVPEEDQQEAAGVLKDYQNRVGQIKEKFASQAKEQLSKQMHKAKKEAIQKISNQIAEKGVKKGAETVWRAAADSGPVDIGELGYIWLLLMSIVQAYRVGLTLFKYKKKGIAGALKEDALQGLDLSQIEGLGGGGKGGSGKLQAKPTGSLPGGGIIKNLAPGAINPLDPSAWVSDIPLALLGWLILLIVFGVIHVLLIMLGLFFLGFGSLLVTVSNVVDYFS